MKTASINEIKIELSNTNYNELLEICLKVIKYKKENKELVNYLLFEANDLPGYVEKIKNEMEDAFKAINKSNIYFAKKSLRKILKTTNKYIKYIPSKEAEAELLIFYCQKIKKSGIVINKSTALTNIYANQVKKIQSIVASLHPDLQFDYAKQIDILL